MAVYVQSSKSLATPSFTREPAIIVDGPVVAGVALRGSPGSWSEDQGIVADTEWLVDGQPLGFSGLEFIPHPRMEGKMVSLQTTLSVSVPGLTKTVTATSMPVGPIIAA